MKIMHVLSSDSYSGAENVVCQIIEMFREDKEIEMIYCSPDGNIRNTLKERNINFEPLTKISIINLKKAIKKHNPDIIHAHDYRASVLCALVCKKTTLISHIHNNPPWIKKICPYSLVYGFSCYKFKKIITVSTSIMNEFVFGKKFAFKTTVIGNPVNIDKIREMADWGKSEKKIYDIAFLGRLSEPKNPIVFIDIVNEVHKEIRDLKAVMIGDGELRTDCEDKIKQLGLDNVIQMTGFQENPYKYLISSKILCMPSKWEGFGLAAVEALALGIPVVCSGVGGLSLLTDNKLSYKCNSISDYSNMIIRLVTDKTHYDAVSKIAFYDYFIDNNTYQKIIEKNIYNYGIK